MERLNLSSTEARTRIKEEINERVARVQSGLGLEKTRPLIGYLLPCVIDNNGLTAVSVIKIHSITNAQTNRTLYERTLDQIRVLDPSNSQEGEPLYYAVVKYWPNKVELFLWPRPQVAYPLQIDGLAVTVALSGDSDVPGLPEDFHDAIIFGVLADEYERLDRMEMCEQQEGKFEKRIGDLRYYISKSAYLARHQGSNTADENPYDRLSRWTQ